ncbi:xylanase [Roseiconus nitratireducens]|uniref:Xylanase n=1 Tax=Roseiconus nitratireducens TaxID=2605748 RepID=A0A5M6CVB9_9BACT|nr:glycoside hydrolase family 30 protein [Roseiconus nitratireducens]KAA5539198.1 xylanase [Roseiconus nitratireducens]
MVTNNRRCQWLLLSLAFAVVADVSARAQFDLTIDYSDQHQQIDHFGASDAWSINPAVDHWTRQSDDAAVERLADWLFSQDSGIGLSAWRFNIGAGSAGQGAASNIPDPLRRAELLIPAAGSPVDRTKQRGQIRFLQAAHARGVHDFVAFANSPPVWATKNGLSHPGDGSGGGSSNLDPNRRGDFASFLVNVVKYLRGPAVGVPINHISPINEPTWEWQGQTQEGCPYNVQDIKAVYRQLQQALVRERLEKQVHVDGPESVEYTAVLSDRFKRRFDGELYSAGMNGRGLGRYRNYIDEFLGDPDMRDILGNKLSLHGYFSEASSERLGELRDLVWENIRQVSPNAKVWMSEVSILGDPGDVRDFEGPGFDADDMEVALHIATIVHRDLVRLNVSAWHWWLALTPYDYKDGLVKIDASLDAGTMRPTKVLWALGNYSRYVRPGYRRIGSGADDLNGLMASAFKSPDGLRIVVVMINASDKDLAVSLGFENLPPGTKLSTSDAYLTNGDHDLSSIKCEDPCSIPARSVVTWVGDLDAS